MESCRGLLFAETWHYFLLVWLLFCLNVSVFFFLHRDILSLYQGGLHPTEEGGGEEARGRGEGARAAA